MIPRYAVVATYNKPDDVARLVRELGPEINAFIVIDNGADAPVSLDDLRRQDVLVPRRETPVNLSAFWNLGFILSDLLASQLAVTEWDVVTLNDDALVPAGWVTRVAERLRDSSATVACGPLYAHTDSGWDRLLGRETRPTFTDRLAGHAHVSRGELGLRFDDTFAWYWGDSDYDLQARRRGGLLVVSGAHVPNRDADAALSQRPDLQGQAFRDRVQFVIKHGEPGW